ncbi:MAG: ribonuclease E/G [Pseudomonadota bacterium]
MKGRLIAIDRAPDGRTGAALMVDGKLEDLLLDAPDGAPGPEEIVWAVVDRLLPRASGAFLRLDRGTMGYLREAKGLREGAEVLVQVSGQPEGGKAHPVTRRILYRGRFAIHTPDAPGINVSRQIRDAEERARLVALAEAIVREAAHAGDAETAGYWEDPGLILRSAAEGVGRDAAAADIRAVMAARREAEAACGAAGPSTVRAATAAADFALREWEGAVRDEPGAFETLGIWDEIDRLRAPGVALASGGSMTIEPCAALVAVDVNTGGDFSPAAGTKANTEAARELPRQLRLRGLGGQVVVDFAPMPRKDRRRLEDVLKAALKRDPIETVAHGWTVMGLFELQRKRERRPLSELV